MTRENGTGLIRSIECEVKKFLLDGTVCIL